MGTHRRTSDTNFWRLREVLPQGHERLSLTRHDITDLSATIRLLEAVQPDEIYNLAAQTHVHDSFDLPIVTMQSTGYGPLCLLEAVRLTKARSKVFQSSSAEMFGGSQATRQTELTPFNPRSPYAAAKVFAHHIVVNYREAYGIFASTGILFNHESPLRGLTFVTRKITDAVARIERGLQSLLELGNLEARRDWGFAPEYTEGFWRTLQADKPGDYIFATGRSTTVRDFTSMAFKSAGLELEWAGKGVQETAHDSRTGRRLVSINPAFFRPTEVDFLCGDFGRAEATLGWRPETTLSSICTAMLERDRRRVAAHEFT
ncbi:MAG: GDP-mannose 4,6-dehydratase [Methylovirgula sp.]